MICAGQEVAVCFGPLGAFTHVGLCMQAGSEWEEPLIAHNSNRFGGPKVSPLSEFLDGGKLIVRKAAVAIEKLDLDAAFSSLAMEKYDVFNNNCEHFLAKLKGKEPYSRQLELWTLLIFALILVWAAARKD